MLSENNDDIKILLNTKKRVNGLFLHCKMSYGFVYDFYRIEVKCSIVRFREQIRGNLRMRATG